MEELFDKKLVDVRAEIEFNNRYFYNPYRYGTKEYWDRVEKDFKYEIQDLEDFIRDHRSRDHYNIYVVKHYKNICKFCGYEFPDDFEGIADCCEEMLNAQGVEIVEK